MKASEMIRVLEAIIAAEGDLEVNIPIDSDRFGFEPAHKIRVSGPDWLDRSQGIPVQILQIVAEGN
jgi:hypothetical protein